MPINDRLDVATDVVNGGSTGITSGIDWILNLPFLIKLCFFLIVAFLFLLYFEIKNDLKRRQYKMLHG